jgi:hypothetical protein
MTPIVPTWQSDSGSMDGLLELLTRCGRDVAEVGAGTGPGAGHLPGMQPQPWGLATASHEDACPPYTGSCNGACFP